MASLLDCDPAEVEADPLGCGRACAARYDSLVLVKGVGRATSSRPTARAWRYAGGGPGLGVSGTGDVLAGIVGGLLARGAEPLTALLWGCGSTAKRAVRSPRRSARSASSPAKSPATSCPPCCLR